MKKKKIVYFKAGTNEEAIRYISELPAEGYNEGDKAEVTFPDGSKVIYVLNAVNPDKYSYCIEQDCLYYDEYTIETSQQPINHICLRCRHFDGFDMYEKKDAEDKVQGAKGGNGDT